MSSESYKEKVLPTAAKESAEKPLVKLAQKIEVCYHPLNLFGRMHTHLNSCHAESIQLSARKAGLNMQIATALDNTAIPKLDLTRNRNSVLADLFERHLLKPLKI